jgi:hypothetical protein
MPMNILDGVVWPLSQSAIQASLAHDDSMFSKCCDANMKENWTKGRAELFRYMLSVFLPFTGTGVRRIFL